VLYVHGGVYADTDARCMVPVDEWAQRYPFIKGANLITGVEGVHEPNLLEPMQVRRRVGTWDVGVS
jgi:hypothetical protein